MNNQRRRPGRPKKDINQTDGTFSGSGIIAPGRPGRMDTQLPESIAVPDPTLAQDIVSRTLGMNVYPNRNSPLKVRKTKLSCLGIPVGILNEGNPEYARTVRLASAYKKARNREYFEAHGYVSSGVGALLAASSLALAGSRYLYELAAGTEVNPGENGGLSLPVMLKMAAGLSDSARQNELSAWELCAREAIVRRRNDAAGIQAPWLLAGGILPGHQETADGSIKRKPGRPSKASLVEARTAEENGLCLDQKIQHGTDSERLPADTLIDLISQS